MMITSPVLSLMYDARSHAQRLIQRVAALEASKEDQIALIRTQVC
jgi:hypothetical protein